MLAGRRVPPLGIAIAVGTAPPAIARGHALARALTQARVGGPFWSKTSVLPSGPRMIFARSDAALGLAAGWLPAGSDAWLALAPDVSRRAIERLGIDRPAVVTGDVDPWALIEHGTEIVAHPDDPVSVIAACAGKRVVDIRDGASLDWSGDRLAAVLLDRLVQRACYREPFNGTPIAAEDAIALLGDWRRWIAQNRTIAVVSGIRGWKRRQIDAFLCTDDGPPAHDTDPERAVRRAARSGGGIAVWPSRVPSALVGTAQAAGVPIVRIEDAFVRSSGFGVHLVVPQSIAVDTRGVHYDPATPSDLEHLLATTDFTPDLLARAARLRAALVRAGLGKYGRAQGDQAPRFGTTRAKVLVVGQVCDDQSVRLGGCGIADNLALLARVRAAAPDAFLIYKPHPDVVAGHRAGHLATAAALRHADHVLECPVALPALLDAVDTVHVLTSLTGFEALLRGLPVTCHGQPFYAGWGLTDDRAPIARRTRRLSLDALVAAALILYPRYLDPVTGLPCPVEILVERLSTVPAAPTLLHRLRAAQGRAKALLRHAA